MLKFSWLVMVVVVLFAMPAGAVPVVTYSALLSGDEVVPPVESEGRGQVLFMVAATQTSFRYNLNWFNISDVTSAEIRVGAPGVNGPRAYELPLAATGFQPITPTDLANLTGGQWYLVLHSATHPEGELRGQLTYQSLGLQADLRGNYEYPTAVSTTGGSTAKFQLNDNQNLLSYELRLCGIPNAVAAHIHSGTAGQNGPVLFNLATSAFSGPLTGTLTLTPASKERILAEGCYVEVHTTDHPAGLVRDQIRFAGARTENSFITELRGANEVSPVPGEAWGVCLVTLNPAQTQLDYRLFVSGLENITAAHLHSAPAGVNGPVIYTLSSGPFVGSVSGTVPITHAHAVNLEQGSFYANVHTASYPGGAMRGQLADVPLRFTADLTGAQEWPPQITSATGHAEFTLSEDYTHLSYVLNVVGLQNITAAHLHRGAYHTNGATLAVLSDGFVGSISGDLAFDCLDVNDLIADRLYTNVHTSAMPNGAIRSQIGYPHPHLGAITPTPSATPTITPTVGPPTITPTPISTPSSPDLNHDGTVDELDLLILLRQWHSSF